jgi:hypothetical protein
MGQPELSFADEFQVLVRAVPPHSTRAADFAAQIVESLRAHAHARTEHCRYSVDLGDVHIASLSSEHPHTTGSEQWTWLYQDLSAAARTSKWLVVIIHRPMYSSNSAHGSTDTMLALVPLMDQFEVCCVLHLYVACCIYCFMLQVDLFLTGHDHSYEVTPPLKGAFTVRSLSHPIAAGCRLNQVKRSSQP